MESTNNIKYMELAIDEAKKAYELDEVPIGCVIVKDGEVIASSHNEKERCNDATKHAEILCINRASKKLDCWYLENCEMYVTLEPCMMCTGAIINSRIKKVYFATEDPKGGCLVSNIKINEVTNLNHYPEIEVGMMKDEASKLLKDFFKMKRQENKNKKQI